MNKQLRQVILAAFIAAGGAQAAPLTMYYANQPIDGVPQPQFSSALGTDLAITPSPTNMLYSQNSGFDRGDYYRSFAGDGSSLMFKFDRQAGDTKAYDVTVSMSCYAEGSNNSMQLLWGTDAFGANDNDTANHGRVWWTGDSADLTQVASYTGVESGFSWNTGTFRIGADQQSAYLMVLGSANTSAYVYSGTADFTAVPEPASLALLGLGAVALLRRRR